MRSITCVHCKNDMSEPKPNLTIMDNSIAHKLIIEDKKCVGVKVGNSNRLRKSQKSTDIFANGEVVLSAGAFISPALLQLRFIFKNWQVRYLQNRATSGHFEEQFCFCITMIYFQWNWSFRGSEGSWNWSRSWTAQCRTKSKVIILT